MRFCLAFILSFFSLLCFSQKTIAVYDDKTLVGSIVSNDSAQIDDYLQKIVFDFYQDGFFYAQISKVADTSESVVKYEIDKGQKLVLSSLLGGNADSEMLKKIRFRKLKKNGNLIEIRESVLDFYENNGYPFAGVALNILDLKNDCIDAELVVRKGPKITVDSIFLKGRYHANPNFLNTWLGIKKGDLYNEKLLMSISEKIKLSDIATESKPLEIGFCNDKANLSLYLEKKKSNSFDGIIGFAPDENNSAKLIFNGDVNLQIINAMNHGEEITLDWENNGSGRQELAVYGELPFIAGLPLGLSAKLNIFKKDTSYINAVQRYCVNYYSGTKNESSVFFEYGSNSVLDKSIFLGDSNAIDSKKSLAGFSFTTFKADQNIIPRKGYSLNAEISGGNKEILKNDNAPENYYDSLKLNSVVVSYKHDFSVYFPIYKQFHVMLRNQSGIIQNENLYENDLFLLGGLQILRGFDQSSISSSKYCVSTAELRYFLEKQSFFNVFSDLGFSKTLKENIMTNVSYWSFGAGLSFYTKAGIFSLYYALGKEFGDAISFKNGKIHFGIVSKF